MMANAHRFWKGMFWGALAGGAVSLLDRETRLAMKENCRKVSANVAYIVKNPGKITDQVKDTALKFKTTVEEVSEDLSYIAGKVEELRETTPEVVKIVKETKDTFTKNDNNDSITAE